jgi:hypothetical protein
MTLETKIMETLATHTQQLNDLCRRIGTLETQFWAIMLLVVSSLVASVTSYRRLLANGDARSDPRKSSR